jgi:hypothetical protein
VLTTNATLVKSSTNIPGLADHDIIITDTIIKPTYNKNKLEKRYLYSKANWDILCFRFEKLLLAFFFMFFVFGPMFGFSGSSMQSYFPPHHSPEVGTVRQGQKTRQYRHCSTKT